MIQTRTISHRRRRRAVPRHGCAGATDADPIFALIPARVRGTINNGFVCLSVGPGRRTLIAIPIGLYISSMDMSATKLTAWYHGAICCFIDSDACGKTMRDDRWGAVLKRHWPTALRRRAARASRPA
jgi:hypothetical protein